MVAQSNLFSAKMLFANVLNYDTMTDIYVKITW